MFFSSERQMADYVFVHLEESAGGSAHHLAKCASASSAAVVMIYQDLGFRGYSAS
ncbi:hypothetical protein [Selenomonas bovis]